ncbi:hypothetical protein DP73_03145 [Desulfosporosinus sp. HMP52]|uniref:hypothetical protein n=1 Tax=Desulfosporosinus sp. HMP52 TaxID=1487923 RepID=UPI00051FD4E6|nr:hypothetical protein [Desulfosporosinus sp. HMP52]KGK91432.1 hypothetical protein DP73_03145 [Desulfosporosinus sp. HMP52]
MSDYSETLKYCSLEFIKGVEFIEQQLLDSISECETNKKKLDLIFSIELSYVLFKLGSTIATKYLNSIDEEDFPDSEIIFENPHILYYLYKMGFGTSEYFMEAYDAFIKDNQTVRGFINSNQISHTGSMRVLTLVEPDSEATSLAIKYLLDNYQRFRADEISVGILSLIEYDYYGYKAYIEQMAELLKKSFTDIGYITAYRDEPDIEATSLAIQALVNVFGKEDSYVVKGISWLKSIQKNNGDWGSYYSNGHVLLALMSVGEGPKVSCEEVERTKMLHKQELQSVKPNLVGTIPFDGDFSIKNTVKGMIYSKTSKIWICSRFITEFWTDLITLKKENPEIDIRIITIPLKEARSKIMGDGKKYVDIAFDSLQRTLERNLKTTNYLHARCVITDSCIIVSSADLSTEQLEKEFNFGIWTKDKESVDCAIRLYQKLWNEIEKPIVD